MTAFLITLHVLVCVFLILFVLLQPGARGGVGAAFGGAGGQTVFGGRGANTFLAKLTAAAAVIFMFTCISLSYFVSHTTSVMKTRADAAQKAKDEKKDGADKKDGDKKDGDKKDGAAATDKKADDKKGDATEETKPSGASPGTPPTTPPPPAPSAPTL